MIKTRFICGNCGEKFTAEVFEPGEAEKKGRPTGPVRCPACKSTAVEKH